MSELRIGYLLKTFPNLSETFILNEILSLEAAGCDLDIISLRRPKDECTHADVSRVRAPVLYMDDRPVKAAEMAAVLARAAERLDDEDVTFEREHPARPWALWQAAEVGRVVRERGIGHVHAHFATEAATVARLASRLVGVTYSFTAHAKDIFHESVEEALLRRNAREARAVVTVSDFNVSYLRSTLGADAERVVRIYNGLDLVEFPFAADGREPGLIVGVGRLVEKKGFDDLVSSCGVLARRGRDVRCVIVGEGRMREGLERQIGSMGLEGRVELLGARPREDVKRIVARAAVLAAPCVVGADGNRDGLPTVLLEAMALGTPCVSTPVTGIPEVVRDGETGLLVAEHDVEGLANAIGRILDDRRLGLRLAGRARELIERSFNLHGNTRGLREIFGVACVAGAM